MTCRFNRSLAALCLTAGMLGWSGTAFAADDADAAGVTSDTITIGTTNPLTGTVASACKPVSDGALAWFDHVNSSGGIAGRKIKNIVLDDQYTAQQALANARQMAAEPVLAFFGGCGTIQVPAILRVAKRHDIPYLFPYAGLEKLTTEERVFLLLPLYAAQFKALIPRVLKEHGAGTVFSVVQRVPGSEQTQADIEASVKAAGGTIVGSAFTTAGQSDQTPLVLKIKQAAPDYIVMAESAPDAARIFKVMQSQNAFPKKLVIGESTMTTGAFIDPAGKSADGRLVALSPTAPADSEDAQSCNEALEAKGVKPGGFSLFGCASAKALTAALEETGENLSRTALMETLQGWSEKQVDPILPPLSFSEGSNIGERSMILLGVEDGKFVKQGTVPLE